MSLCARIQHGRQFVGRDAQARCAYEFAFRHATWRRLLVIRLQGSSCLMAGSRGRAKWLEST